MRLTPIIDLRTVWGLFRACLHRRRIEPVPGGLMLNSVRSLPAIPAGSGNFIEYFHVI